MTPQDSVLTLLALLADQDSALWCCASLLAALAACHALLTIAVTLHLLRLRREAQRGGQGPSRASLEEVSSQAFTRGWESRRALDPFLWPKKP